MEHKGGYWYVSPWRMHCIYCLAEVMSNSEKTKPLSVIKPLSSYACLKALVNYSVSPYKILSDNFLKNSVAIFWRYFRSIWKLIWAYFTYTNIAHHRLRKLRLVIGWYSLMGHAYSSFISTMNHYSGSR